MAFDSFAEAKGGGNGRMRLPPRAVKILAFKLKSCKMASLQAQVRGKQAKALQHPQEQRDHNDDLQQQLHFCVHGDEGLYGPEQEADDDEHDDQSDDGHGLSLHRNQCDLVTRQAGT